MSDIIAQLEVLSRESGCVIDLSAILDLSICPKIDFKTPKPHKVEEKDDYICVTPTEEPKTPHYKEKREIEKRCDKGNCFEVREEVCKKNHVALDLELLVILGLLTEEQLEKYLHTTGELDEDDHIDVDNDDVGIDPLISVGVGDDDSILDLEVGGEDGLINLDGLGRKGLLNIGGKDGGLLNLNLRRRGGNYYGQPGGKAADLLDVDVGGQQDQDKAPIDVDVITHPKLLRRYVNQAGAPNDRLLDVDVGGPQDDDKAAIDVDVLTHPHYRRQNKGLLDLNVGGYEDEDKATIDLDLLTRPRPAGTTPNNPNTGNTGRPNTGNNNGDGNKGLLDLNVGGYEDEDKATIDLDLLTRPRPDGTTPTRPDTGNNGGRPNTGNNDNNGGNNGNNGGNRPTYGNGNGNGSGSGNGHHGGYLSHYQPLCNKGFKKPHSEHAKKCHAKDVNHCLAICHSQSALLTLEANAKVGDVANILLCAAVEFNSKTGGDNCRYFVAPETEPCHDEELEDNDDCYTFVRN